MKLLLDTHLALWLATEFDRLSQNERALLLDRKTEVLVSAVSIWELRIKWDSRYRSGERKGPIHPAGLLTALERLGQRVEPLSGAQCAASLATPTAHSDPFDRLLLVVAQEREAKLLTRDQQLRSHPLALIAG